MTIKKSMIDTVTLSTDIFHFESENPFYYSDLDIIRDSFIPSRERDNFVYKLQEQGINLKCYKDWNILHITFNPSNLLNIDVYDHKYYNELIKQIQDKLSYFRYIDFNNLKLNRVDYKVDFKLNDELLDLYIKLFKKLDAKVYLKDRQVESICRYENSNDAIIYNKEKCYLNKGNRSKAEEFKNVLRFETHIKRPALHYRRNSENWGLIKTLDNYSHEVDAKYFLNKNMQKLVYRGNYYNLYHSTKILNEHYTKRIVEELIELQKLISIKGIASAKEIVSNNHRFNLNINRLQKAEVNPIVIPKNAGITSLDNLFNFTKDNIYSIDNYNLIE